MNKVPPIPHRSISVREQREQLSPQFQRSVSAYGSENTALPVEIGSKGSIFSLVGRDMTMRSSSRTVEASKNASHYVWLNRLWIIPRKQKASHKRKDAKLETVVEGVQENKSLQENKVPIWKRFMKKLKGGSNSINSNVRRQDNSTNKNDKSGRFSRTHDSKANLTRPPFPPLPTSIPPTKPIWERRDFAQISPLDFSHLHTSRIKKELARKLGHN